MKHFHLILQIVLGAVLVGLIALLAFPPKESGGKEAPLPETAVLFLGNSYTYFNDLPGMVEKIGASDKARRIKLVTDSVTQGGARLAVLWEDGKGLRVLRSRHWDYVVLQEQSFWASHPEFVKDTFAAAENWNREIMKQSGRALLFGTWARQAGSSWYTDKVYEDFDLQNFDHMQQELDIRTRELAGRLGAKPVMVGDAWMVAQKLSPPPKLYASDGHHPTKNGSYLAALLFYRAITGSNLEHVEYVPWDVTAEDARQLIAIAARSY